MRNRIETIEEVERIFDLTDDERRAFDGAASFFRFAVTPYYALISERRNPDCAIRKQVIPVRRELEVLPDHLGDPLGEESREAAPNLIHRYPDRALLLATDRCPVYCRFCTRRRIVGRIERQATRALFAEALEYIERTTALKEVIISGGDALMLGDNTLQHLLARLREIDHIDIIRVATRMPVTCPMRVTDALAEILAASSPVYVMTHFNHVVECTPAAEAACARLVDRGVVIYNQSVLLRGINDTPQAMTRLNRKLVSMRVTPYYLHQCDMAEGIEHFRTPLQTGIDIIDAMRGHTSGLMVPQLCVDVPGGLGKVTVQPTWIEDREGPYVNFRTYTGEVGRYRDPEMR